MENTRPPFSLNETIALLTMYLDLLKANAEPQQDESLVLLQRLLGGCHDYLSVYKASLQSMIRIKDGLETLKLQHTRAEVRPQ